VAERAYEADIMFKYRFMVDNNLYGIQWMEIDAERVHTKTSKLPVYKATKITPIDSNEKPQLKHLSFDIECLSPDISRAPDSKKDEIIIISMSFYPDFQKKKSLVLVAKNFTSENTKGFQSEKEMLEGFIEVINDYDPDIITGYNINNFDIPWIIDRCGKHGINVDISRSEKKPFAKKGLYPEYVFPGRVVVDPYQLLKRDPWVKFIRYNLNTVAKVMLNDEKHDVEYKEIKNLWNSQSGIKKLVEYARQDADLALRLVVEKNLLDKFFEISKISGVLLQDAFGGQTKRIETLMLHDFKDRDFVMPFIQYKKSSGKELKGATVLEPQT